MANKISLSYDNLRYGSVLDFILAGIFAAALAASSHVTSLQASRFTPSKAGPPPTRQVVRTDKFFNSSLSFQNTSL